MTEDSPFLKWYVEQYGPRLSKSRHHPFSSISDTELTREIRDHQYALNELERERRYRDDWDMRRDAALKGWTAHTIKERGS